MVIRDFRQKQVSHYETVTIHFAERLRLKRHVEGKKSAASQTIEDMEVFLYYKVAD